MLKQGLDRNQLRLLSLETLVSKESLARVVDAFVDALDFKAHDFVDKGQIKNGAPAYPVSDLLKLYYYGYLYRVRSLRRLEREGLTKEYTPKKIKLSTSPSFYTMKRKMLISAPKIST